MKQIKKKKQIGDYTLRGTRVDNSFSNTEIVSYSKNERKNVNAD